MKKHSFLFSILTILFLCFSINAQTPTNLPQPIIETKKEQTTQEKQAKIDKKEVQKFTDLFLSILLKTKDISKIPKSFFAKDYYENMMVSYTLSAINETLLKEISDNKKLKFNSLIFNMAFLGQVYYTGRHTKGEKLDDEEKGISYSSEQGMFPPSVLLLYKKSKFLIRLFDDDNFEIQNVKEFDRLISEFELITNAQRNYLIKNNLPKKNSFFIEEIKDVKNVTYWEQDNIYSKTDDKGNHYIDLGAFMIRLRITKINNKPKILNIFMFVD